MSENERKDPPAYVSYVAFNRFINELRENGVPDRIDKSLFPTASGSQTSAMLVSLRFLKLMDQDGKPTKVFHDLVEAADEARGVVWKKIVEAAYGFLITGVNLEKATGQMVAEKFRAQEMSGSTLTKAIMFFLAVAKDAGIKVAPHIKPPAAPAGTPKKARKKDNGGDDEEDEEVDDDNEPTIPEGAQRLKLPVVGKGEIVLILPANFKKADWTFMEPIFKAYIDQMLKD